MRENHGGRVGTTGVLHGGEFQGHCLTLDKTQTFLSDMQSFMIARDSSEDTVASQVLYSGERNGK